MQIEKFFELDRLRLFEINNDFSQGDNSGNDSFKYELPITYKSDFSNLPDDGNLNDFYPVEFFVPDDIYIKEELPKPILNSNPIIHDFHPVDFLVPDNVYIQEELPMSILNSNPIIHDLHPLEYFDIKEDTNVSITKATSLIKGFVKDASGNPLQGASVSANGLTDILIGTETLSDGSFSLEVPTQNNVTVRFIGYKPEYFTANGSVKNITLEEDSTMLDEAVIKTVKKKKSNTLKYIGIGTGVLVAAILVSAKAKKKTKAGLKAAEVTI